MKLISKLLSIAILLIGVNGNASFAETQLPRGPATSLFPIRHECLDLLQLERVEVNSQKGTVASTDPDLLADWKTVWGWLQGFFTAWNINAVLNAAGDGNVTKGAKSYQVMAWIFSYCRAHPSGDLDEAALEFINAMRSTKN